MNKKNDEPRLYVIMRTDLASLNSGKAIAQGAHAANQCVEEATQDKVLDWLKTWRGESGKGFGTTIVLGAKYETMKYAVALANENGLHASITHDDTYPLTDGETLHLIPLDTCAYLFGPTGECQNVANEAARWAGKNNSKLLDKEGKPTELKLHK